MAKKVIGDIPVAIAMKDSASARPYGCGNLSRRLSQIRRSFACRASDETSAGCQGRTTPKGSVSSTKSRSKLDYRRHGLCLTYSHRSAIWRFLQVVDFKSNVARDMS